MASCRVPSSFRYWVCQLLGAILAAFAAWLATGRTFAPAPAQGATLLAVLVVETVFTCLLCLTVLQVATTKATSGNSFYGLAIGFTIVVAATGGGPVSGGAFNPAVATGGILTHTLAGAGSLGDLWYYWVGPLLGSLLAVGIFSVQGQE